MADERWANIRPSPLHASSANWRKRLLLHDPYRVQILTHSPQIGRPVKGGKRELVIGRASRGYLALYQYVGAMDTSFVLVVRSQREVGFKR